MPLTLDESLRRWDGQHRLTEHRGYTPFHNALFDAVMPMIPPSDFATFAYAYRRIEGYRNPTDALGNKVSAIPQEEFVTGRRRQDGEPIDYGSGLAQSSVQLSIERLVAAGMLIKKGVSGGKRGRPATVYTIEDSLARWTFAPFLNGMSHGQLGRYVDAARWGKLPPPRTPGEMGLLLRAIEAKEAGLGPTSQRIAVPEDWLRTYGFATGEDRGISTDNRCKTFSTDNRYKSEGISTDNRYKSEELVPIIGTNVAQEPSGDAESGTCKETLSYEEETDLSKDTSGGGASGPAPGVGPKESNAKATKRPGHTPPRGSVDGRKPQEWIDAYVEAVYTKRGEPYPPDFRTRIIPKLHDLRATYSLEDVLACRSFLVRSERRFAGGDVPITILLDRIGGYVARVKRKEPSHAAATAQSVPGGGHPRPAGERQPRRHVPDIDIDLSALPNLRRPGLEGLGPRRR